MPGFVVGSARELASMYIPLTEDDAQKMCKLAEESENGNAYINIKSDGIYDSKVISEAFYISYDVAGNTPRYFVHTEEYHPRKYGKAEMFIDYRTRR